MGSCITSQQRYINKYRTPVIISAIFFFFSCLVISCVLSRGYIATAARVCPASHVIVDVPTERTGKLARSCAELCSRLSSVNSLHRVLVDCLLATRHRARWVRLVRNRWVVRGLLNTEPLSEHVDSLFRVRVQERKRERESKRESRRERVSESTNQDREKRKPLYQTRSHYGSERS